MQRTRDLGTTSCLPSQSQALLIKRFRSIEIAAFVGHDAEIIECRGDQHLIANLPRQRQTLLEICGRLVLLASIKGDHAEIAQGPGDSGLVAMIAREGQRLLMEPFRAIVVALCLRQDTGPIERRRTCRGCLRPGDGQRSIELLASLSDMAAKPPETPQRCR